MRDSLQKTHRKRSGIYGGVRQVLDKITKEWNQLTVRTYNRLHVLQTLPIRLSDPNYLLAS